MERATTSRRHRASEAVGRVIGGSFKKRSRARSRATSTTTVLTQGLPSAAQEQREPSFGKRKSIGAALQTSAMLMSPLKRARTWSSTLIMLSGGVAQPQRVIGYHRTKAFLDVVFHVIDASGATIASVEAHRNVIAAVCELKLPDPKDSTPVDLPPPCHPEAFTSLVEFCYTGKCTVADYLIVPFIETAAYCRAHSAIASAFKAFEPHVNAANCLEILACARRLRLHESLTKAAETCVRAHFEEVRMRRQFLQIDGTFMHSLVADPCLGKRNEQSVFEATVSWLSAQQPPPSPEETRMLLERIKYNEMPVDYVRGTVLRHPTILAHPDRHGLLLESFLSAAVSS